MAKVEAIRAGHVGDLSASTAVRQVFPKRRPGDVEVAANVVSAVARILLAEWRGEQEKVSER